MWLQFGYMHGWIAIIRAWRSRLVLRALGNWKEKNPVAYDAELDFPGMKRLLQRQEKDWMKVVPRHLFGSRMS